MTKTVKNSALPYRPTKADDMAEMLIEGLRQVNHTPVTAHPCAHRRHEKGARRPLRAMQQNALRSGNFYHFLTQLFLGSGGLHGLQCHQLAHVAFDLDLTAHETLHTS